MADRNGYIGRAPGDSAVTVARQTFSPTGVTTDFTFSSGYTVGYLDLFLNGTKLIEGVDYTATDTSTISLISAAINGDVLEGVAYKAFNLGDVSRIGIQSAGTLVGNVNTLNFVGTGNSISLNGGTIDVSISGGGSAGAGGTWSNYDNNTGVTTTKKVKIQNDLEVTGVSTFAAVNATTGSFSGNVSVGGTLTYEDVTNVDSVGLITARSGVKVPDAQKIFLGTGDDLQIYHSGSHSFIVDSGVGSLYIRASAGNIQDQGNANQTWLQFNSAAGVEAHFAGSKKLETTNTGITVTGNVDSVTDIFCNSIHNNAGGGATWSLYNTGSALFTGTVTATTGVQVGAGQSFGAGGPTAVYYGDGSNLTNLPAAGLTTEALVSSGIVTTLNLTAAQDHKVTASGITTITVSGGTEAESHTVRIINSGITTVGFSTYFLFPSGSTPSLPTADGAISLISFTVNRVGAGGTQLLAGASVNYS